MEFVSSDLHGVQGDATFTAITIRDRDVYPMALNSNPSALCVSSSSHSLFSKPVCACQQTDRVLTFALTYTLVRPDDLQHRILNSLTSRKVTIGSSRFQIFGRRAAAWGEVARTFWEQRQKFWKVTIQFRHLCLACLSVRPTDRTGTTRLPLHGFS